MNWWQRLRHHDRLERELDVELRYHFDREVADNIRMGMSEAEARRRARIDIGFEDPLKEGCRDARGTRWVADVGQDLRLAARMLWKDRGFTLAAAVALGLGIGMNGTMFTIVNAMTRGLPVDRPNQIMSLHTRDAAGRWQGLGISYLDFRDVRAATKTFSGLAAFSPASIRMEDDDRAPENVFACYVSANAFSLLGLTSTIGRGFIDADDRSGAGAVVILGDQLWTTRYNADPTVVGRVVRVNGRPATVIGVMPKGFRFPVVSDLWQPLAQLPGLTSQTRDMRVLQVFGRLADGHTQGQAQAEVESIAMRLGREYPDANRNTGAVVTAFPGDFAPRPILVALMTAVGFVLLVACINVANLLLARSARRSHEISIRVSLGATRWRVVRQCLVESGLIGLTASALALSLTRGGVWLFADAVSDITFPYYIQWTMDERVALFVVTVCLGSALMVGLLPALQASQLAAHPALREGERTATTGLRRRRWTTGLLAVELALTLVLLSGAGLMMRSYLAVYRADSVVDAAHVMVMGLSLPDQAYPTPEQRAQVYEQLEERVAAIPGIASTAFASVVPFAGGPSRQLTVEGWHPQLGDPQPLVSYVAIRGRYFDTLGLRVLRGRTFNDQDATPGSEGAIVNQRLAEMFFSNADPVGRRICLTLPNNPKTESPTCSTVVGVSPTVRQQYFQDLDPVVYVPDRAQRPAITLMVRSASQATAIAPSIRAEVFRLNRDIALNALLPLNDAMTQSRWGHRVFGGTLTLFALVALLLAGIGLYAITAYSVVQRTQEIGVRMALGARPSAVVWLFLTRTLMPVGAGIAVGLVGALAVGRLLQAFLIDTGPADPTTLVVITTLLLAVSLAACFFPARRATHVDPIAALRYE